MEMTSFLAGIAVGYSLSKKNVKLDMSVKVIGKEILNITIGNKVYTLNPNDAKKVLEPEHLWETNPYYSGWRDKLDIYYLEKGLQE